MLKRKCLGRLTASLLLLCTIFLSAAQPAAASAQLPEQADTVSASLEAEPVALNNTERTVSIVHRTASASGAVIGCLENGTIVKVLSTSKKFYKIDCYDMKGYIAASQVSVNEKGEYYVNCIPGSEETKTLPTVSTAEALSLRADILTTAKKYIGVKYVWGGTTPKGFDCSGFTQYVFRQHGYTLGRMVVNQLDAGVIVAKEDLQCGDLVFFQKTTHSSRFATHIGIYIGNGQFIHAGSKGITIASLDNSYWVSHYLCARRVILSDITAQTVAPDLGVTQNINSSYWRENAQTDDGLGSSFT